MQRFPISMSHFFSRAANIMLDFLVFIEILVYWSFVLLVMLPVMGIYRMLGTRMTSGLDKLTRFIADL